MAKKLLKGNVAIAEAAIQSGLDFFFGYPITPQNDIPEYLSEHLPEHGGTFLQAESELAAINMCEGAAATGARVMTSTSGPGFSLMQEGVSNIAAIGLPMVIVNMMRSGPGSGTIYASQGDYFQATRGGGNGDYNVAVLAPASVQEAVDLLQDAFDLTDKYRIPVMLLGDAMIGQMMEPAEILPRKRVRYDISSWATRGWDDKSRARVAMASRNPTLQDNIDRIEGMWERFGQLSREYTRCEEDGVEDAEAVLIAYGSVSRIAKEAVQTLREQGLHVGLLRPITLWPFPYEAIRQAAEQKSVKKIIVAEMSAGQMLQDVRLGVEGVKPIAFFRRLAAQIPIPDEIVQFVKDSLKAEE
jgi:2-oxoglutarate ferredoxin oxidoreductase subunit alpha